MRLEHLRGNHKLQGIEVGNESIKNWSSGLDSAEYIKFKIDGITYKAIENPDDGYRSYMEELIVEEKDPQIILPNIEVTCIYCDHVDRYGDKSDILEFIDIKNGKTVLIIGTEDIGDYYPGCVLSWIPENLSINEDK